MGCFARVVRTGVAAFLLCASLSGCLVMGGSQTTYEGKGKFVDRATLDEIEPDETTRAWLLATLGEPSEVARADGVEVLTYRYVEKKQDSVAILFLMAASNRKVRCQNLHFEITDGVVSRFWQDSSCTTKRTKSVGTGADGQTDSDDEPDARQAADTPV
ncbi:MAG: hypothetical protein KGY99_03570 [Phycisphaerae bacterium]|nr:hypothetical protein [Phycisphaerae bacterium]